MRIRALRLGFNLLRRHDWGIDAIATDPVDTNRLYVAAGAYTNEWDPNDGSILRSTDQGTTWAETKLPFKVGGNMPGRGIGEVCLQYLISTQLTPCSDLQLIRMTTAFSIFEPQVVTVCGKAPTLE
jgi:hypothetical protein